MRKKILLALVILVVIAAYFFFDGGQYLSVDYFRQLYRDNPLLSAGLFFLVYFLVAAFSLPAAALLTVIAGMIFGLATGTVLVSFASSLGATVACLFSRFIFRDWVRKRLGGYLEKIDRGLEREGASYLFTLRLIPAFPFWAINLAFGLTRLPITKFYLVSQVGMLPGTLVYVNAGAQLGAVESFSLEGILTPGVVGSFLLLALFPYVAKSAHRRWQRRKIYAPYPRPARFDANLLVIGAGSAGLITAYLAAAVRARVTLVEKAAMGGDCLNTGCVPSKALLRAARAAAEVKKAGALGVEAGVVRIDFPRVMAHVRGAIAEIEPHDSVERYQSLGVDCMAGEARMVSPWEVEVDGRRLTSRNIVIATGARPRVPDIPGLHSVPYLTSENLWQLESLPRRLLVLGGGPVGCELAQAFQRLGSSVTLVQRGERLLPKAEEEGSRLLARTLEAEGVNILFRSEVIRIEPLEDAGSARVSSPEGERDITFDRVLVALGRAPNTQGLGLEALEMPLAGDGTIRVDEHLRTRYPNVLACGDVAGPYQFTHAGAHQAWYAVVNALFGRVWSFKVDYRLIPAVIYTDPEVASVGLTTTAAAERGIEVEVTHYPLEGLDRAITDGETAGFVRILTPPGKDRILGVTIVAAHAGEMLMEFIGAMKQGKGLNFILSTIHPYPIFSEANKAAAGQWKRNHTPEGLLRWVEKYHRWQRKA